MDLKNISKKYRFIKLKEWDFIQVYRIYNKNTLFYEKSKVKPTLEMVRQDAISHPYEKNLEDKFYLGIFDNKDLIGIFDFIINYPKKGILFIGLFMLDTELQDKGIGSQIIQDFLKKAKDEEFKSVRLAFIKGYDRAEKFWLKNGFYKIGLEVEKEKYTVVLMERTL